MAHMRHETKAVVIEARDAGEASRELTLFTRECGLVRARAQGVRELGSKLRYALQKGSFSFVSLLCGRNGWRIIDAHGAPAADHVHEDGELAARIFSLLPRFLGEEEPYRELFDDVESALAFVRQNSHSQEERLDFEIILVLRVLYRLGYFPREASVPDAENFTAQVFSSSDWNELMRAFVSEKREYYIKAINESFRESQL